jgi:capsule polysaccharide export protein KpsE/RkpR
MADKQVPGSHEVIVDGFEDETTDIDLAERRAAREKTVAKLHILWDRRRLLFQMFLCGFAVSFLLSFLISSEYQSGARLMPPDQQSGSGLAMLASLAGKSNSSSIEGLAGTVLGTKTTGDLFLGVLASRTVQDGLILKFDLRRVYGVRRWETARKKLAGHTDLSADRKSGIITIEVTDRSPQRAAAMTQEYINELNLVMTEQNTSAAHRERVFLEQRLQQVKQDLEVAENGFSDFASKNAALDIPTQGKAIVAATASLEGELIAAQTQLQGLKQIYTDNNVRVRSTQARIDELQRQLAKLSGRTAAKSDSADPPDDASPYPSFRQLPVLGVSYADLLRNAKVQEATFEVLTQEYEMAKVEEAKEIPSVKILDAPNLPESKSFPPRILITFLGSLAFLAAGITWILGSAHWNGLDSQDATKGFAQRVFVDVTQGWSRISGNGAAKGVARIWPGFKRSPENQSPDDRAVQSGESSEASSNGLEQ